MLVLSKVIVYSKNSNIRGFMDENPKTGFTYIQIKTPKGQTKIKMSSKKIQSDLI